MWATRCSKDIMYEYENRKKIKKFAKEMTQTRLQNELTEGADRGKHQSESSVLESKMRLKYWDYFRSGNIRLLEFMGLFRDHNHEMEKKTSDPEYIRQSKHADLKIKRYIVFLEKNIETSLIEVTRIKNYVERLSKVSTTQAPFSL